MLGKIEGRKRRGWQRMRLLDGITDSVDMRLSKQTLEDSGTQRSWHVASVGLQRVGHHLETEPQQLG